MSILEKKPSTNLISTNSKLDTPADVMARIGAAIGGYGDGKVPEGALNPSSNRPTLDLLNKAEGSLDAVSQANAAFLRGEVPDDVVNLLKRQSAERVQMQGLGTGAMARNISARDLGLTSMDMIQRGVQTEAAVSEGFGRLSEARDAVRRFDDTFQQQGQQLLDNARKTTLQGVSMGLEYQQFRANLTMEVNAQIQDITKFRETMLLEYSKGVPFSRASSNQDGSTSASGYESLRGKFSDTASTLDSFIDGLAEMMREM
jgi:hypothetical protein